jgi:hypothetical protein
MVRVKGQAVLQSAMKSQQGGRGLTFPIKVSGFASDPAGAVFAPAHTAL